MTDSRPPRHRRVRITQEPTRRLALLWRAPRAHPAPGDPPRLGPAQLILTGYGRDPDGHILLGPVCYSLPELDGFLRQLEASVRILRHKATRLYTAQAKARARARP